MNSFSGCSSNLNYEDIQQQSFLTVKANKNRLILSMNNIKEKKIENISQIRSSKFNKIFKRRASNSIYKFISAEAIFYYLINC